MLPVRGSRHNGRDPSRTHLARERHPCRAPIRKGRRGPNERPSAGPVDPAKGTCGIPTFHRVPQGSNGLYAKLACVDANTKKPLKMVADPNENTKAGYLETAEKIAKATKVTFEHGHVRASFECKDDTCGKLKEECGKMKLFFKVLDGNNNPLVLVTICGLTYNMECKGKANGYKCPGEVQRGRRRRILRFRGGGGS